MSLIIEKIIEKISELESEYQECQGLILSEDDLKCHIFRKIYPLFDNCQMTMDPNIYANPLHTEIKFFDENDKLTLIPDITILEPEDLSIVHSLKYKVKANGIKYLKTSNKEFEFGGNTIIIELKFCRNKSGINSRHVSTYQKDINKIKKIQEINTNRNSNQNKVYGLFIVFNKTDKKSGSFDDFIHNNPSSDTLKTIYKTGKFINNPEHNWAIKI